MQESKLRFVCGQLLILAALSLAILFRYFFSLNSLATHYIGGADQDAGLYVWLVRSFSTDWPTALRLDSNAFYPYGLSRAWSDNFLFPSFIFLSLKNLGFAEPLAYNSIILGAAVANGYCVYILARALQMSRLNSLAAGLLLQNASYLWTNLGHPQLQFVFFIPLILAIVLKGLKEPRFSCWICAGLVISAAFLTTVYYSIFCVLILGCSVATAVLCNYFQPTVRTFGKIFLGTSAGLLPLVPFIRGYLNVAATFDSRHLYEAYYFSASAVSYVSFSPFNHLYDFSSSWSHPEGQLGASLSLVCGLVMAGILLALRSQQRLLWLLTTVTFIGLCILTSNPVEGPSDRYLASAVSWVLVLFSLFWAVQFRKAQEDWKATAIVLVVAAFFFLLSLGPLGNQAKGEATLSVFVPFYYLIPGVDSLRAVARYGIVVWVCLSIAFPLLTLKVCRRVRIAHSIIWFVVVVSFFEGLPRAYPIEIMPERPQVIDSLSQKMSSESAALFLPLADDVTNNGVKSWGEYARLNTRYMNWSTTLNGRIVNGYSGQRSKLILELPAVLRDFPSEKSLARLATIAGLRFIVIVPSLWPSRPAAEIEERISTFSDQLTLLAKDSGGNLLLQFSPRQFPPYLLSRGDCSVGLTDDSTCSFIWADSRSQIDSDLMTALRNSPNPLHLQQQIASNSPHVLVRPRITALRTHCETAPTTTIVCE